ncbi:MAG: hypothetical protein ACPGRC_02875 [Salibacteraceae bacterium]
MKNFLFIISLVISTSSLATIYETIDVNGVINWSTDGGITDCGCDPGNSSKHDSIYVLHPYTFSVGFFGSDGAIEAPMVVSVSVVQVVF